MDNCERIKELAHQQVATAKEQLEDSAEELAKLRAEGADLVEIEATEREMCAFRIILSRAEAQSRGEEVAPLED